MQITKAKFGKEQAKVKYLQRYKARGAKMAPKTRLSDQIHNYGQILESDGNYYVVPLDHATGSKPNHAARYADITDCFPLLKPGQPHA